MTNVLPSPFCRPLLDFAGRRNFNPQIEHVRVVRVLRRLRGGGAATSTNIEYFWAGVLFAPALSASNGLCCSIHISKLSNHLALFKSPSGGGVNKNGVSNILRSIGHFLLVRSNCWGPVTSENKCAWAPKPCIMRSFGLKMRQKQVRETFRKVCQTCFCAIIAVCCRDF